MHVSTFLDIDLVAVNQADELSCLVQMTAPVSEVTASRPGQSLVIVLDRSGSMHGAELEGAKAAIAGLLRRLAPQDAFGLVVFDDQADVVIPVRLMKDHDLPTLETLISRIDSGGSTDLSAGYVLGLREIKRVMRSTGLASGTLLLVSDGHANAGNTDPVQMKSVAAKANTAGVVTSTLGLGVGYDEILLDALARGGNGTHAFSPDIDAAMQEIQQVVTELLDKSVMACLLRIKPKFGVVSAVRVLHDLPHWIDGDALVINVGDLFSGEERKVMFTLSVPALEDQGTSVVADVVLEYTELPAMAEHSVGLPIAVNVVPGDEARNRIPNPVVEVERLMTDIDARKRSVSSSLRTGQIADAQRTLAGAIKDLNDKRTEIKTRGADASLSARLDEAAHDLLKLAGDVQREDADYAGKSVMHSLNATSRGRKVRGQETFPEADAS